MAEESFDWVGSIVSVAEIAARIIPLLLAEGKSEPWETGPVAWLMTPDGQVLARNTGSESVGLLFSKPAANRGSVSHPIEIPPSKTVKVGDPVDEFLEGEVMIAPANVKAPDVDLTMFAASFALVGLGVALVITKGITCTCRKTKTQFSVQVKTNGPDLRRAAVQVTDPRGNSVRATATFADSGDSLEHEIPIPSGVDLDPIIQQIVFELEFEPASVAEQLTAGSELIVA